MEERTVRLSFTNYQFYFTLAVSVPSENEASLKKELLSQKEKISSLEEDLAKKNENLRVCELNIKSLTSDKQRHEAQLASVRQVCVYITLLYILCVYITLDDYLPTHPVETSKPTDETDAIFNRFKN